MPGISQRGIEVPASPIRRLMPFAEAAVASGVKIFHLNIGQPDIHSPAEFWEGVRDPKYKVLEYANSIGHASLRERTAAWYQRIGIDIVSANLIVTTAGSEALRFAMLVCLNPGDEVIVPEPLYANYIGFSVEAGVNVVAIPSRIEDDFALPSTEEFEKRITPRTKAILICNPSNPTGGVYSRAQIEQLADLVKRHNLYLIADEVYRDFNYTDEPVVSVLQIPGLEKHAVMIDSVSKRFSLCGARIGFLVSRNAEVIQAATKFAQARLSPPTLEQFGVERALDHTPRSYFDAIVEEYRGRRDLLVSRLSQMDGVVCPRIDGAFYAMVRLPIDDSDRFCQWMLETFRHDGQTVMMAPGTGFYTDHTLGTNEVRIAYVLNQDALGTAMDCLHQALSVYPGRTSEQQMKQAFA